MIIFTSSTIMSSEYWNISGKYYKKEWDVDKSAM